MGQVIAMPQDRMRGEVGGAPRMDAPAWDENGLAALHARRAAAARRSALEWMETQARVLTQWRLLMSDLEPDAALLNAMEAHAAFLGEAVARLR